MQGPPRRHRSPALRLAHVVRAVDREALQVAAGLRRGRGLARGKVVGWKGFTERALGETCNATPSPHTTGGTRGAGMAPRLRTRLCPASPHPGACTHSVPQLGDMASPPPVRPLFPPRRELLWLIFHHARKTPKIFSSTCTCFKVNEQYVGTLGMCTRLVMCPGWQHNWEFSLPVSPPLFEINTGTFPSRKPAPNPLCPPGHSHRRSLTGTGLPVHLF